MKQKLLEWGFTSTVKSFDEGIERFDKSNTIVEILVYLGYGKIRAVQIRVGDESLDVPNCNSTLGLFTLLYQLGLVEV